MREFHYRYRVRYRDVDQMQVAAHAKYLEWLEEARIEWLRSIGSCYRDWERQGILLPVLKLQIRYYSPVRFDDLVDIVITIHRVKLQMIFLKYQIFCSDDLKCKAETQLFCVNTDMEPMSFPQSFLDSIVTQGYVQNS